MTGDLRAAWSAMPALLLCAASALLADGIVLSTGSRAPYVHRISLYDEDGEIIGPHYAPAKPYSPSATCGKCHDHGRISCGWHFSEADPNAAPGRTGEPWILTDLRTGTQLPVSSRPWPATYRPAEVGLTPWQFVLTFGRYTPGGGLGDKHADSQKDAKARWTVSGKLEIDCMICHSGDPRYDVMEWANQIEEQNLKWAPVAAAGLAVVRGSVKKLPDTRDALAEADPEADTPRGGPRVIYDAQRFDQDGRVLLQITRKPPVERCYLCHFSREAGEKGQQIWRTDPDVHLAAGLTCTDCHRNGLDHAMARGVEDDADNKTLSCRGCHESGRLGAPRLRHRGLPAVHLQKLACTACHSGLRPAQRPHSVRLARPHGLGMVAMNRRDDVPPFVVEPIFLRQKDGKLAPHRMMWPSFWGRMKGQTLAPIPPDAVAQAAAEVLGTLEAKPDQWKALTEEQVAKTLKILSSKKEAAEEVVYVASGNVYRLCPEGRLLGDAHPSAVAYAWPVAHEVRPAGQSLGSAGCQDCHAKDAGLFFGRIEAQSPAQLSPPPAKPMYKLQGYKLADLRAWERCARHRSAWITVGLVAAGVLALVMAQGLVLWLGAALRAVFVRTTLHPN